MFDQIFLSLQVKRWVIITYKHGKYKLPHELPNDLRKVKVSKLPRMIPWCAVSQPKRKFC